MRKAARSLLMVLLALVSVLVLTVSWSMSTAVTLTATALIMGGTGEPNPGSDYRQSMTDNYIDPWFGTDIPGPDQITVVTPEEFWPTVGDLTFDESVAQGVTALSDALTTYSGEEIYVLGYSQSTRIQAITKRNLIAQYGDDFNAYPNPDISFVMTANLNKPNGGLLQRLPQGTIPVLGLTADGSAPTNSPKNPGDPTDYALDSKDFSFVHDGFSDFPACSLCFLAVANAIAGMLVLHPTYPFQTGISPSNPDVFYQGSYGDTDYYMIRTDIVPLLSPLGSIDVLRPLALFLDESLRVLIERGYDRETSPGEPTKGRPLPRKNPITVASNFVHAFPVGFDDAAEYLGRGRPLNTEPSGPFGVGGPTQPIDDPTQMSLTATQNDVPVAMSTTDDQPKKSKKNVTTRSPGPLQKAADALAGRHAKKSADESPRDQPARDAA